ncbi:hypothetical protein [Nocardia otitidiscaviarum]|uniref:hypothetical protein n=1 Tax=Nocardia otitidiscaviarum TaxID=1823 RepID=UPI0004A74120|nr:hypothetical protein [Nocardia otitidiscaviarum]
MVLTALREGNSVDEAAELIGRTAAGLHSRARSDSELRLALAGADVHHQHTARMGDYLAALTRHQGDTVRAGAEIGATDMLDRWRSDPAFATAEKAVMTLATSASTRRVRLDQVADRIKAMWEAGYTTAQIADDIGAPIGTVSTWVRRLALPKRHPGTRGSQLEELEPLIRQAWSAGLTHRQIAAIFDVTVGTVGSWVRTLHLPRRREKQQ